MNINTVSVRPIVANKQCNISVDNSKNRSTHNIKNEIGQFPSYYCPNISFGSKFGEIDFDYDFYRASNDVLNNHLDKMDLTKNLSKAEQEELRKNIIPNDKPTLLNFMFDAKPSILLSGEHPYFRSDDKYDVVRREGKVKAPNEKPVKLVNTFILNKELVKNTISENKELYTRRMNMHNESSVDDVYKKLIGDNSPLKKMHGYDDIIGVTLGFSPINSMLFQLEQDIPNHVEMRMKPDLYFRELYNKLNDKESPYATFSKSTKTNMENFIKSPRQNQAKKPDLSTIGYSYIQIVADKKHSDKIIEKAEKVLETVENLRK